MRSIGLTHVGNVRSTNEDTIYEHMSRPCYVLVADGMGGHAAGEVASSIAANAVREHIESLGVTSLDSDQIIDAVQYANHCILDAIAENDAYQGMGTTITLAYLQPDSVTVAHVGDSSAYLCHGDKLTKITRDHTYVQRLIDSGILKDGDIADFPFQNVITRALGMENVQVDLYRAPWQPGDSILLCSDGLTAYADRERLLTELSYDGTIEEQARHLLDFALAQGGRDNISVIIVNNSASRKGGA